MEEEIAALCAIYGAAPGESVERMAFRIVRVKFPRFSVTFDLPEDYPDSGAPRVGVSSEDGSVARSRSSDLSRQIEQEALKLSGSPMLLDLTTLALELVADITETSKYVQEKDPEEKDQRPQQNCLLVIELDHMRDRRRYIDCLRSWTTELGLWCRLVMGQRRILLAVASSSSPSDDEPQPHQHQHQHHHQHHHQHQHQHHPVKTFEKRLRTCKVDVDSRGRPCKERMATVLCEREIILSDCRSGSFEVREVDDLEDAFKVLGLSSVYEQFVSLRADKRS